jgi:signal transduction histidine kinase
VTERVASFVSLWLLAATVAIGAVTVPLLMTDTAVTYGGGEEATALPGYLLVAGAAGVSLLGRLIVQRARNVIGWAFQVMALGAVTMLATELAMQLAANAAPSTGLFGMDFAERVSPESGAIERDVVSRGFGVELLGWIYNVSFLALVLPIPPIFLLFPTGRPLSPRWAWALRAWVAIAIVAAVWSAFRPGQIFATPSGDLPGIEVSNPFAVNGIDPVWDVLGMASATVGIATGILSAASLVVRFRRARGEERAQMKWLALVGAIAGSFVVLMSAADVFLGFWALNDQLGSLLWGAFVVVLFAGTPIAVAVAVLKYRLYDVDVVINKAVVYATLAIFISVVYVGLVVGVGALLGRADEPNVALQIAATAVVAVAFQPVRERAQRLANRVVYGTRATPYEVLSGIARRAGETYATEEVLSRMAKVIAEGTGASRVDVWVRSGDELMKDATWPTDDMPRRVRIADDALPRFDGVADAVEIRHQGVLLGAITIAKPRGEPLTRAESHLLDDLASHAGLVLRNVGLTRELRHRVEDVEAQAAALTASRQRIVAAQDSERRRLERNIHDGAQQHLVALAVKLRLARGLAASNPAKARSILEELQAQLGDALDTLIDLARGIYPPLLEEQGLAAALAAQYLRGPLDVTLHGGSGRRYPIEVEAAAYFCILEALQNAAKYARASHVRIALDDSSDELAFKVIDDGIGFDPSEHRNGTGVQGMFDRVGALGGELSIDSAPGRGTTVAGRIPVLTAVAS